MTSGIKKGIGNGVREQKRNHLSSALGYFLLGSLLIFLVWVNRDRAALFCIVTGLTVLNLILWAAFYRTKRS